MRLPRRARGDRARGLPTPAEGQARYQTELSDEDCYLDGILMPFILFFSYFQIILTKEIQCSFDYSLLSWKEGHYNLTIPFLCRSSS